MQNAAPSGQHGELTVVVYTGLDEALVDGGCGSVAGREGDEAGVVAAAVGVVVVVVIVVVGATVDGTSVVTVMVNEAELMGRLVASAVVLRVSVQLAVLMERPDDGPGGGDAVGPWEVLVKSVVGPAVAVAPWPIVLSEPETYTNEWVVDSLAIAVAVEKPDHVPGR